MKTKRKFKMGVGMSSMLMIFVVLCLTTFAVLSYVTANADAKLTQKAEQKVTAYYTADSEAQRLIGELDGRLVYAREKAASLAQGGPAEEQLAAFSEQTQQRLKVLLENEALTGEALERQLYETMLLGLTLEADNFSVGASEGNAIPVSFTVAVSDSQYLQVRVALPLSGERRYRLTSYALVNTQTGEEEDIGGNLAFGKAGDQ